MRVERPEMGSELAKARLIGMSSPKNYSKPPTVIQYAGLYGLIQGLIGIAFGIFLVVREAQGFHDPTAKISGYGTALWFFFIFGAVAVCGYFLYRGRSWGRSEEHTSELQSRFDLVCRLLLEKKNIKNKNNE